MKLTYIIRELLITFSKFSEVTAVCGLEKCRGQWRGRGPGTGVPLVGSTASQQWVPCCVLPSAEGISEPYSLSKLSRLKFEGAEAPQSPR